MSVDELMQAREVADIASVQNRYSVVDRAHESVLAACELAETAFLPWRPVAGAATGTAASEVVAEIADEIGATPAQVALAWLLAHSPVVVPIPGMQQLSHLEDNVAAAQVPLTSAQRARLDALGLVETPGQA